MAKLMICTICSKPIKSRSELITARYRIKIFPYHVACFTYRLKSKDSWLISNQPINGLSGNLSAIIYFLFGLSWLLLAESSLEFLGYIVVIPLFYRLYSYVAFERHLP